MKLVKPIIEKLYYQWWVDVCKSIHPSDRARLRCAVSIVEAYLCEVLWEQLVAMWKAQPEGTNSTEWTRKVLPSVRAKLAAEATTIKMLADKYPDTLVSIAGVINGIRHASNRESAIRVMLLLDLINETNADAFSDVIVGEGYRTSAKAIYFPLKEPAVHGVCSAVEKALKANLEMATNMAKLFKRKAFIITRALNLAPVLQAVA